MIAAIARWLREEIRLLGLETWAEEYGPPDPHPCTSSDPRCARLAERQAAIYQSMRRVKSHVLDRESGPDLAHTDVRATIDKARAMVSPIRAVRRRA